MVRGLTSILLTATALAANANAAAPIVDLGYAQYQGYFDPQTNITNFLGIRYAAPPTGSLRFQAPQPPAPEPGVLPATQNPNICYQASFGLNMSASVPPYGYNKRQSATPASSEDCLFLNVFIPGAMPPEPAVQGRLPVLVWIHGGGYVAGSAIGYNASGAELVVDSLNTVLVVVIQYRLGAFGIPPPTSIVSTVGLTLRLGFLPGNEVKAQGALNAGLLDQAFALQWVQDRIELFGGNKNHVTIWGASAGAGSVLQHIVANGGSTQPPLFNAAITSSTFLPSQYYYNDRVPQSLYNQTVAMTGCSSSPDTFTCLQSVNADTLETVNYNLVSSAFYGTFAFAPVVDGAFIVERPSVTLDRGWVNGRILLSVTNQNEGYSFVNSNDMLTIADYVSRLFPDMTSPQVQQAAKVYQNYGTAVEQAIRVMGDSIFICPTYYLLDAFVCRSWKGLFAIPPAYHGGDAVYYFYSPSDPPPYNNIQFITAFSQSFMSVAKYYDVNTKFDPGNITPHWDKYRTGWTEMLFNRTEAGVPVVTPITADMSLVERCEFWKTVTARTAQ